MFYVFSKEILLVCFVLLSLLCAGGLLSKNLLWCFHDLCPLFKNLFA
jgi:hypothetical protein